MPELKKQALSALRFVALVLVSAALFTGALAVAFRGSTKQQQQVANALVQTNLAQACILALPSNPDTGRDPGLVQLCFTQYGLQPPALHNP